VILAEFGFAGSVNESFSDRVFTQAFCNIIHRSDFACWLGRILTLFSTPSPRPSGERGGVRGLEP
jgi:hypothetical protein